MKIKNVLALALSLAACNSGGGNSSDSSPPTTPGIGKPEPQPTPDPEPEPEDQDEILTEYTPDFSPLLVKMYQVDSSKLEFIDDYLSYQQGIAINWEESREGGYVPEKFLSLWDDKNVKYVDISGGIKGIEKLETIRREILEKCPVLAKPEYNSPVEVHWGKRDDKVGGIYRSFEVTLSKDEIGEIRHYGGINPQINNTILIYGKNKLWNFPKQTNKELDKGYGIDSTFIHEWGHHLMFSVDINLGRNSHTSWEMSESFARSIEYTCFGSYLDTPERTASIYDRMVNDREYEIWSLTLKTEPYKGGEYNLRSMEACIAHEKHLEKFDPNAFATALIDSYKCVQGKKPQEGVYPVTLTNGDIVRGPWVSSGYRGDLGLNSKAPLLVTREEFLGCFRQHYDCGLANDLIDADIEGKSKFEW